MNNDDMILNSILNEIKKITDELDEGQFNSKCFSLLHNSPLVKRYSPKRTKRTIKQCSKLWEEYKIWVDEESKKYELE
ncbi:hypothetical protein FACS189491_06610 [Spirochaetia bacterium]|nr:hypothetical protein FACS189491_06610 [Spirochaetia bacterium]